MAGSAPAWLKEGIAHRVRRLPLWVRARLQDAGLTDIEIANLSPRQAFRRALEWEGIIGYADDLWDSVVALRALEKGDRQ